MGIKNVNGGSIDSGGGDVRIGDNITYIIDGLSLLVADYKEQLEDINKLIFQFKARTALNLLESIELRINESHVAQESIINGKIAFLKAVCKRELIEYKLEDSAKDFITAHALLKNDTKVRDRACIEYINLKDKSRAVELANKIIVIDEYNFSAWFVKVVTSDNKKEVIKNVPSVLKENNDFLLSVIHDLIMSNNIKDFQELQDYDLILSIPQNDYKEVTFQNKNKWIIAINLLVAKQFNDTPMKYISGDNFNIGNSVEVKALAELIGRFISKLNGTEIEASI